MGGNGRGAVKSEGGSWEENVCGVLQNQVGEVNNVFLLLFVVFGDMLKCVGVAPPFVLKLNFVWLHMRL